MDGSPEAKMQDLLWQLSYRRHPYQWPVIGVPTDLPRITTQQLIDYYHQYLQPGNATLVVVGDFASEELFSNLKKYYEKIPAQVRPARDLPIEPEQQEERRLVVRDLVISERFARAYHITSADHQDSYALDVLADILFEGTTSRGYQKLVEQENLLISLVGSSYTPTYPGLFMVSGTLKGHTAASVAEDALDRVIENLQEYGVSENEVHAAVRKLALQFADSIRTAYGLGQMIGTVQTVFGDPQRFVEDLSKYMKVTPQDVRRVAIKYLQPNNRSVVHLVPLQNGSQSQ
jgi:zinc protease